jgi:osmoprotectant transport system ATP-binding protein
MTALIEFRGASCHFGATCAIDDVSLAIERGEFVVLLGASGAGKSTLLKMINRLVEHDRGAVLFDGRPVTSLAPEDLRRRMGYAIQSIGLFPHWSVARNVGAVPELLGWPRERIAARVDDLLSLLHLDPAVFRGRWPHELSGGQQQRVGVARALAADPEVLLMDEPFGALDPVSRHALQDELLRIHRTSRKTVVMVTHDVDEALRLATRLVLMDRGRVVQDGAPLALISQPVDESVRAFFGGDAQQGLRLLALRTVADVVRSGDVAPGEPLAHTATLRDALSAFVGRGCTRLPVVDATTGRPLGAVHLTDLLAKRGAAGEDDAAAPRGPGA